jgi:galactose mutarotase-like enzyme
VIIPELGGKIASLEIAGRQWLWTNPSIPFAAPRPGASYGETADSGGYDECFPTVSSCTLPPAAESFARILLPDHGELWSQRPSVELATGPDGHEAKLTWRGAAMPYRFTRTVRVEASGEVVMRYSVRNDGRERMPFVWSPQPLFPLTDRTRLLLPIGEPVRLQRAERVQIGEPGSEHRWPLVRTAKEVLDLSRPGTMRRKFAAKVFFAGVPGTAAIEEGGTRLEVRFESESVPDFGVWINHQGWSPKRKIPAYSNVALQPSLGAPDSLDEALTGWRRAQWVEGGKTRKWTLRWVGKPATSG